MQICCANNKFCKNTNFLHVPVKKFNVFCLMFFKMCNNMVYISKVFLDYKDAHENSMCAITCEKNKLKKKLSYLKLCKNSLN